MNKINNDSKKKVNLILQVTSCYINHFIDLVNKVTSKDYFGIKSGAEEIIIEKINLSDAFKIIDDILFEGRDSFIDYKSILNIVIEPIK